MKNSKPSKRWEEAHLKELIQKSQTKKQVLVGLGLAHRSTKNYSMLNRYIREYRISVEHFEKKWEGATKAKRIPDEKAFVENSPIENKELRRRIIDRDLVPYRCQICFNEGEWRETQLTLQLDHINGIRNDNRIENLRFLCPNCHSQQKTTNNIKRY